MGVKVYVWREQPNETGHVSMEVDGTYMSYWPASAAGQSHYTKGSFRTTIGPATSLAPASPT